MSISSDTKTILMTSARQSSAPCSCRTQLCRERPTPFAQVDQREHGEGTVGVLRQTAIARLGEAPQALEGQKRMLDLGAHRRLSAIGLLVRLGQRPVLVRPLVGEVFCLGRDGLELFAWLLAPVGTIPIESSLLPVQQVGHLLAVMHVARGNAGAVHQAAVAVHTDVPLHAKIPLVTLLALVHLRIPALLLVL